MSIVQTEHGTRVSLAEATTSGYPRTETSTVTYLHASVGVYTPAPGGGQYVNAAVCTHNHPDTDKGLEQVRVCAQRLGRIIAGEKRLPKWAVLT